MKIKSNLLQLLSCFFIILVFGSGSFKTNSSLNEEASKHGGSDHIAAQTFTFRELAAATRNFRAECLLGEGGFGRVYKGLLESTNQVSQLYYSKWLCMYKRNYEQLKKYPAKI